MTEEKTFVVTFHDWFQAKTEDEAFDKILEYLRDCVVNEDLSGLTNFNGWISLTTLTGNH